MGKDLRGRELGVGISQRKDGLYTARYTARNGKRKQAYFHKLQECRNWLADRQFEEEHGNILFSDSPTVDAWYGYWIKNVKGDNIRTNTRIGYEQRYKINIQPIIGHILLKDLKPIYCQNVLASMSGKYKNSIIAHCRMVMKQMFECAVENGLIYKNPVVKSVKCVSGQKSERREAMTVDEQRLFWEAARGEKNYNEYLFCLQTGLRVGELTALRWQDVDFKGKVIHVRQNMGYRYDTKDWEVGEPKTKTGIRDIPLTQEAVRILKNQKEKNKKIKVVPMQFTDLVFLQDGGHPIRRCDLDVRLHRLCDKIGMRKISMHTFRHTFATRCIEAGMRPKTLQMILGHANINMTMNLYVHVMDDEKFKEVKNVEYALKMV